jgi:hypothetical protein
MAIEHWLDALARHMATGRSRRQILRWLGTSAVGVALASGPGWARAEKDPIKNPKKPKKKCTEGTVLCGDSCCTVEACCGGENGVCCGNPNKTCANGQCVCRQGLAPCGGNCCSEGLVCPDPVGERACCRPEDVCAGRCCAGRTCCNGVCCPRDETCVNGQCRCGTGSTCPEGAQCTSGVCCPAPRVCATGTRDNENRFCCAEGTECFGSCTVAGCNTICCAPDQVCGEPLVHPTCCPAGMRCRNGACVA